MASREPSDDEILQVVDFAGLNPINDRAMVVQALKDNAFNVESVVMQYFDNPASFRQKFTRAWNDSMFTADRDGTDNHTGISFHIESIGQNDIIEGVTPPPDGCGPCAPSRPPSRSNNRSPLGQVVDWTAGGGVAGGANSQSREDEDMQRALRESAQEAGIALPSQESGILDATASMPHFGPANRNEYDQDSWAMVPTESKVATSPAPDMRKRTPGAPALLVQGNGFIRGHCLGGLVTILHEIPLARNVLLQCGAPAASYGFNSEWWKGQEILPPQILAQLQSGEMQWDERHGASPSCEEEVHRLMAFLDSTERSYGTASLLTDLIPFPNAGPEKRFYEHLMQGSGDVMGPLTQVASLCSVFGDDAGEEAKFGLLEMVHEKRQYDEIETLYESLDHVMWSDVLCWGDVVEESKMAAFGTMGNVFAFKIGGGGPTASIEIPEEFYPERYLLSRKEEAQRIQRGWCEIKKEIESIDRSQQQLHSWVNDLGQQSGGKKDMMHKVVTQWKAYSESLEGLGRFRGMEESGFDTDKYPDYRAAPCRMTDEEVQRHMAIEYVIQEVEGALSSIIQKLAAILKNLEQIRAKQRSLSKLLTVPNKPGRPKPMTCKKYLLRGVATPTDVVYLCQRSDVVPADTGDRPKARDQWWRLAYSPKDEQPVKAEKIEIERVFREVWQETKNPLLVYATEDALSVPRDPLSSPLERFVRAENKAFRQELNQERSEVADGWRTGAMEMVSPSKRKHRSDSADSMDSNRASLGSDGRSGFDNPFEDEEVGSATEMTDMSGIRRTADDDEGIDMPPSEGGDAPRPSLPGQLPAQAENTSATLTPSTLAAEEGELTMGEQGRPPTTGVGGDEVGTRPPEMQERCRPPVFVTASKGRTQHEGQQTSMDIPDHKE